MGIQSRDYMKRPSDSDGRLPAAPDSNLENLLSGFLRKHPRFFVYLGAGLIVLIISALLLAKLS